MIFRKIFNAFGFYFSWWMCVLGVVKFNFPYLGPIVMLFYIVSHLLMIKNKKKESILLLLAGIFGLVVDSLKSFSGFITYNGIFVENFAPLWIIAMWIGFSATINHSGDWVKQRYLIAIFLGIIFGPLNYLAGNKMGALSLNWDLNLSVIILAIIWGISVPALYFLAYKINSNNN